LTYGEIADESLYILAIRAFLLAGFVFFFSLAMLNHLARPEIQYWSWERRQIIGCPISRLHPELEIEPELP
jgi:hypothetical protein